MAMPRYIIRDTVRLFSRHCRISLMTLFSAAALFFLVGGSSLLALNVHYLSKSVESSQTLHAYTMSEEVSQRVETLLKNNPEVVSVWRISPQSGLERLQARLGSQMSQKLSVLDENSLPWCIEVRVYNAKSVTDVARRLEVIPEIDDVVYSGQLAQRLGSLSSAMTYVAVGVLVIALFVSTLVFYNTIRLGIYSRRQEISVMLLVGATPARVAWPFILHGLLIGLLGALLAAVSLFYAWNYLQSHIVLALPLMQSQLTTHTLFVLDEVLIGIGLTLGWTCSYFAVKHYVQEAEKPV